MVRERSPGGSPLGWGTRRFGEIDTLAQVWSMKLLPSDITVLTEQGVLVTRDAIVGAAWSVYMDSELAEDKIRALRLCAELRKDAVSKVPALVQVNVGRNGNDSDSLVIDGKDMAGRKGLHGSSAGISGCVDGSGGKCKVKVTRRR